MRENELEMSEKSGKEIKKEERGRGEGEKPPLCGATGGCKRASTPCGGQRERDEMPLD